jgi:subtilisin family serine protease
MGWLSALALLAATANAQLRLPGMPIALPAQPLQSASQLLSPLDSRPLDNLTELRHIEIERLVRANRRVVDVDPNGQPIVRSEILSAAANDSAIVRARSLGFVVAREQSIDSAGIRLVVLGAPTGMSTTKALRVLRSADPNGVYDFNHIYLGGGAEAVLSSSVAQSAASPAPAPGPGPGPVVAPAAGAQHPVMRIGLLDTGIDAAHPVFHDAHIHTWGCENSPVSAPHGTAIASLLIGRAAAFQGVQPDAELYAADVYCGRPTGGAVDALVGALGWLIQERVPVINISLVGPKNSLLQAVIARLVAEGFVIVAAVGNDGPAAAPLYPASYPGVVGVTAVDSQRRVLIEAARGPQVMFASPGADMAAAGSGHGYTAVRGTSFAAPIVTAMLAADITTPGTENSSAGLAALAKKAIDLGPAGRDLTYGYGLVGAEYRVDPKPLVHR